MEYKIEETSPVQRKVNITVPAEEVGAALGATIAIYRAKTDIKGFRRGKAPSSVIEAKFKKDVYTEARNDLINYQVNQILNEIGMTPLSGLEVDAMHDMVKGEDYVYTFSFEVAPQIDLPEYRGLKAQEEKVEADLDEVKKVEDRIRKNLSTLKVIEEVRNPVDGETVTVSFGVYEGDKILDGIEADNFELTLGEGQALPEFEELARTLKAGETGEKELAFPEDFINTKLAGKTALIKMTLHAVKERIIPELTDEMVKKAGFQSLDQMRKAVEDSYVQSRKQLVRSQAQKRLLDSLMKDLDYPLPPVMVEERIENLLGDLQRSLDRQGKSLESLGKNLEELRAEYRPKAEDLAKTELFLMAVAAKEELTVNPEEMDEIFKHIAEQSGQSFYDVKRYHEERGLVVPLKDRLLCDKAMELIYDAAQVEEVSADELKEDSAE